MAELVVRRLDTREEVHRVEVDEARGEGDG